MLVGALGRVGRGFGRARRAELGCGVWPCWVGRGIWLWWARWAGLGKVVVNLF